MSIVLATVDPGKQGLAWAIFVDELLVEVGMLENIIFENAYRVLTAVFTRVKPNIAVIEIPQVYQQRLQKGDPNDLIDVAVVAGMVAGTLVPWVHGPVQLIRPRVWKGNRPKAVDNRHTLSVLSAEEKTKIPSGAKRHNVLDAVGIGLWKLGRR
jgi:hypothetical protein